MHASFSQLLERIFTSLLSCFFLYGFHRKPSYCYSLNCAVFSANYCFVSPDRRFLYCITFLTFFEKISPSRWCVAQHWAAGALRGGARGSQRVAAGGLRCSKQAHLQKRDQGGRTDGSNEDRAAAGRNLQRADGPSSDIRPGWSGTAVQRVYCVPS